MSQPPRVTTSTRSAGDPGRLEPLVHVVVDTARRGDPLAAALPAGAAYRLAPMLAVIDVDGRPAVVVGRTSVVVDGDAVSITGTIRGLWRSDTKAPIGQGAPEPGPRRWRGVDELPGAEPAVLAELSRSTRQRFDEAEGRATEIAKALAEQTRDAVEAIRSLRYEIEAHLSSTIRGESDSRLDVVLADLVELSVITGRARDETRMAIREGLGAWRSNEVAYHARRRRKDPSLPPRPGAGAAADASAAESQPWFAVYDAGVRQCEAAESQLGEELQLLQGRLMAASTVATARDAQAQESLTLLATVGGVALGVPGVIVGLYGVSTVLPLGWNERSMAVILPIAVASLLATLLAFATTSGPVRRRLRRALVTLAMVVVLVCVIAYAGYNFPAR